ncbi:MAG: sulfatase, partial [Thermodesulfobacteriota bacterium]|nr:sulfatase [Thermodesulfobacteriota bacterium]
LIGNHTTSSVKSLGLSEFPPLSLSLLMIFGLVLSIRSEALFIRLRFVTNPWTASIVLLGLPWLYNEQLLTYSRPVNATAAMAYTVSIFLISFFFQRILQRLPTVRFKKRTFASSRNSLVILTFAVVSVLGLSLFSKQSPPNQLLDSVTSPLDTSYPNIILITMDAVRADHLSLYGYDRETTPNLKRLSQKATLFARSIASGDMTLSTHASIFTGMYARQHGAHFDVSNGCPGGRPLDEKFRTLAEILSEKGYLTMGVVANPNFLSHFYRLDQGFQYYDNRVHIPFLDQTGLYFMRQCIRNILAHFLPRETFDMVYRRAEEINKEVFNIIDKAKQEAAPFFLFVNYMDAHNPYIPPSPFDTLYPGKDETFTSARYYALAWAVIKLERKVAEEEQDHLISQYDGGIGYIDFHLGKLIERLKDLGLYENTLIIITSDHGEVFGERNLFNHGVSVYQDQVYIPLLIKYPNDSQRCVVDELVSVVDLMPTILDVLGDKIPKNLPGKSLLKLGMGNLRSLISETFPAGRLIDFHPRFDRVERAIFLGKYKFISSTAGKKELYSLTKDPSEKKNIYQSDDVLSLELERRLARWLETTVAETDLSAKGKPDKETLDRLKTLGYIQ